MPGGSPFGDGKWEAAREALYAYFLHIVIVLTAIFVARESLPMSRGRGFWPRFIRIDNPLIASLSRWDGAWYLDIIRRGYNERSAAFFPLYPWAIRSLSSITGMSAPVAGILLSNLAFIAALALLYRLVAPEWGETPAHRAVLLLALFPAGIFFSAVYTESLFLCLVLAAFLAARRRRWLWAGLAGCGAALTRNLGVFLVVPLALEYVSACNLSWRGWRHRTPGGTLAALRVAAAAWPLLLVPIGLGVHMAYLGITLGNPLAFMTAQRFWERSLVFPAVSLIRGLAGPLPEWSRGHTTIDFTFALTFLVLLACSFRRIRWSEWLYFAAGLLVPLSSLTPFAPLTSLPRYASVLFPAFVFAAVRVGTEERFAALLAVSGAGLALAAALFANWYWVA